MAIIHEIIAPKSNADEVMLVSELYFSNNDYVRKGDELLDLETSKTTIALDTQIEGYVEYKIKEKDSISVGEVVICIHDEKFEEEVIVKNLEDISLDDKIISYAAQSYIEKNNIDVSGINKKIITLSDVRKNLGIIQEETTVESSIIEGLIETVQHPIGLAKKVEIEALLNVQAGSLISTISINVNAIPINTNNSLFSSTNDSYLPIILNEASKLLRKFPALNSFYQNNHIYEYIDINIGVALDIDDGLKVYNIRECDNKDLDEIKDSLARGVYSYLRKELTIKEITETTFTITDLSQYGVSNFIPLVNSHQSAILGVSAVDKALKRFSLSLSFDHRVTEGKYVSMFLSDLVKNIEQCVINNNKN